MDLDRARINVVLFIGDGRPDEALSDEAKNHPKKKEKGGKARQGRARQGKARQHLRKNSATHQCFPAASCLVLRTTCKPKSARSLARSPPTCGEPLSAPLGLENSGPPPPPRSTLTFIINKSCGLEVHSRARLFEFRKSPFFSHLLHLAVEKIQRNPGVKTPAPYSTVPRAC